MTRVLAILVAAAFSASVLAAPSLPSQVPVPGVQADKAAKPKAKKSKAKPKAKAKSPKKSAARK